jgi:hypothetical protein
VVGRCESKKKKGAQQEVMLGGWKRLDQRETLPEVLSKETRMGDLRIDRLWKPVSRVLQKLCAIR